MSALSRILLIENTPAESRLALAGLSETGFVAQTTVVKDQQEALDFLHERGPFRRRLSGLPAVIVLGPSIEWPAALSLLKQVRSDPPLRRIPVVIVAAYADAEMVQSAYDLGVNSLVRREENIESHAQRYAALGLFWGWANEPPPGCLPQPKSERRLA